MNPAPMPPILVELSLCRYCGSDDTICGEVLCRTPLMPARDLLSPTHTPDAIRPKGMI